MDVLYPKREKLKSKREIELLFSEGKSVAKYPIRLIYRKTISKDNCIVKAGVSVSKRNFKSAVDRNRIKRLLRESYRKNKYLVLNNTTHQFTFLFLYTGKEMPKYSWIESKINSVLQQFIEREIESR